MTGKRLIPSIDAEVWGDVGKSAYIVYYEYTPERVDRLVLLNAVVTHSEKSAILVTKPISIEEARELVKLAEKIESYIGHEATAKVLTELLGVNIQANRGEYTPREGDVAIVVRLKRRLEKPEDVKNVKPEDLSILVVHYWYIKEK